MIPNKRGAADTEVLDPLATDEGNGQGLREITGENHNIWITFSFHKYFLRFS